MAERKRWSVKEVGQDEAMFNFEGMSLPEVLDELRAYAKDHEKGLVTVYGVEDPFPGFPATAKMAALRGALMEGTPSAPSGLGRQMTYRKAVARYIEEKVANSEDEVVEVTIDGELWKENPKAHYSEFFG